MYCTITRQKTKRKPRPSRVYKNPRWEPAYPGADRYELAGNEIERDPKDKFRITLSKSFRVDRKVKKSQWHIATLTYWHVIDDFIGGLKGDPVASGMNEMIIFDALLKHFPASDCHKDHQQFIEGLFEIIRNKFEPIKDEIIRDYKQSEEYKHLLVNLKMKTEREKAEAERLEREERERAQQREEAKERFSGFGSFNANLNRSVLTQGEQAMALEIIKTGYKKMAQKYHPDMGGDTGKMQELNSVKDKIIKLL